MNIDEILQAGELTTEQKIAALEQKTISVPAWANLVREYDPRMHPVKTDPTYRDITARGKQTEHVTRITLAWQKLATKRMAALLCGIPVRRVYQTDDDAQKAAAEAIEGIYKRNRIDAVNLERARYLYASCECVTIWYAQETPANYGGHSSPLKLRCRNYAPIKGDELYPLFDEYDDLIALSVKYQRIEQNQTNTYFDTYTATRHICWRVNTGETILDEPINIGKIAGVYIHRDEPVWETESGNVYEAEWTYSRSGNYIRKNARPKLAIYTNNPITTDKNPNNVNAASEIVRLGQNDKMEYVTWQGSTDAIKWHVNELKQNFNAALQLPDISMDNMKSTPMSGESRKMLFIDAQMKVTAEAGAWLEYYDREFNVIRAYAKRMFPNMAAAIDALHVDHIISPYQINDEKEKVETLVTAAGGAIASKLTAISRLGWVNDAEDEARKIDEDTTLDVFGQAE